MQSLILEHASIYCNITRGLIGALGCWFRCGMCSLSIYGDVSEELVKRIIDVCCLQERIGF